MTGSAAAGWALALAALVVGYLGWGGRGLVLAVTVIVFWLLLQFNRAVRAMRRAARAPVGRVPSAVMVHAKLRPGLSLAELVHLTGSLGAASDAGAGGSTEERYVWRDEGGRELTVRLRAGRVASWTLGGPSPND